LVVSLGIIVVDVLAQSSSQWRVVAIPQVGGLHHRYERRAA
jgi:hypothetical protein